MIHQRRRVRQKRSRRNRAELDRLSTLPDSLILHIICLLENTKIAVQTCVLSKKWMDLWKHLPSLHLESESSSPNEASFRKFVRRIMSKREPYKIESLRFFYHRAITNDDRIEKRFFKKVISYAAKLGVDELDTNNKFFLKRCCLSLPKLRSLKMKASRNSPLLISQDHHPLFGSSVTRLHLENISFSSPCDDLFSRCINLEELTLTECEFINAPNFITISSTNLLKLTLNFSSSSNQFIIISAPKLMLLNYKDKLPPPSIDGCPSLERVNIIMGGDCQYFWNCYKYRREPVSRPMLLFDPKMKMLYKQVMGNIIPKTKSFVLQHLHWKWKFTKCDNSASVEVYAPKTYGSWKMDVELSSTSWLEYNWNGFGFFDIFDEVSFASYPDIINTLSSSGEELHKTISFMSMFTGYFDGAIKKKLARLVQKKKKLLTISSDV